MKKYELNKFHDINLENISDFVRYKLEINKSFAFRKVSEIPCTKNQYKLANQKIGKFTQANNNYKFIVTNSALKIVFCFYRWLDLSK